MAFKTITNLPASSAVNLTDLFEKVDGPTGASQKCTGAQIKTAVAPTPFSSAQTSFSATTLFTFAHSLGVVPSQFRCVMVNQSTDLGYTAGMEVDIRCVFHTSSGTEFSSVYADATNVYVAFREGSPAAANIRLVQAAGGVAITGPDVTKWKFKVYALA